MIKDIAKNNITENSYKDPSGTIVKITDSSILRSVYNNNKSFFLQFTTSELFNLLVEKKWILPIEIEESFKEDGSFKSPRIKPTTYPYEWTFHQLKDAALLTLKIQNIALKHNYSLKDATPFNIVFEGSKPIFVDYFSFETYKENESWVAFEQFMKMFYLPLTFRSYSNINLNKNLITNIDGFNIIDYVKLLPIRSFFNFNHFINLILPYRILKKNKRNYETKQKVISKNAQLKMIQFLYDSIKKIKPYKQLTTWNDYYSNTILENEYLNKKTDIITRWIQEYNKKTDTAIDFGTNNGYFAKKLNEKFSKVIATDIDFDAVDELYLAMKKENINKIYPLQVELHNPSPSIGWNLKERESFNNRFNANLGTVLAITHHLRITNNVPFELQAKFFASMVEELIIEYVDKKDPKVQILLSQKEDVYPTYSLEEFKNAFEKYFIINKETQIDGFERVLFKMERR